MESAQIAHDETIGEAIRRARMRLHMSQGDLALMIGVSAPTVGTWERGVSEPRLREFAAIARALDAEWLVFQWAEGFRIGNRSRHLASVPIVIGQLEFAFDPPAALSVA